MRPPKCCCEVLEGGHESGIVVKGSEQCWKGVMSQEFRSRKASSADHDADEEGALDIVVRCEVLADDEEQGLVEGSEVLRAPAVWDDLEHPGQLREVNEQHEPGGQAGGGG